MRIGNIKNRGTLYNFLLSSQLSRRVHLACVAVRKTLREREEESERENRERNENPFWPLRLDSICPIDYSPTKTSSALFLHQMLLLSSWLVVNSSLLLELNFFNVIGPFHVIFTIFLFQLKIIIVLLLCLMFVFSLINQY